MKVFRFGLYALSSIAAALCAAWAFGALYFDFPKAGSPAAILFVVVVLAAGIIVRGKLVKIAVISARKLAAPAN